MKTPHLFRTQTIFAAIVATLLALFAAPGAHAVTVTLTNNVAGTNVWFCPTGVTTIQVECWGGGGAGGAATSTGTASSGTSRNSGGGGGGAYAKRVSVPVTPGNSYTIGIPAAAVSGANGSANGAGVVNGGNVTFVGDSAVTVTAAGGSGGQCASNSINGGQGANGGAGGTTAASVGDAGALFAGGSGYLGFGQVSTNMAGGGGGGAGNASPGTNALYYTAGLGGAVGGGNGGNAGFKQGNGTSYAGTNGFAPGGGGGGAKNSQSALGTVLGGNGGLGQILLTYNYTPDLKTNNTANLNLASSWTVGVPGAGDVAIWDSTVTGPNTTVLGANLTFGGIAIQNPGGLVTINAGNTLTNSGNIDMSLATADLTLNCNLALGAANVWNVTNTHTLTVGGTVSGANTLTKQGAGTAILSGPNTYTGGTTINAGILEADNNTAVGTGLLTMNGGTLSNNVAGITLVNPVNLLAASTVGVPAGTNLTFSGIITNTGALTKTGSGNLTLNGTNTFTGTTTVSAGALTIGGNGVLGNGTYAAVITNNGTLNYSSSSNQILSGIISGTGALNYLGTGTLTLSVSNSYSGGTTVTNGTVSPGNGYAFGAGSVTVSGGTVYATAASMIFTNAITLNGGTWRVGGGSSHALTNTGPVTVTATNTSVAGGATSISCDGGTGGQVFSGGINMGNGGYILSSYANGVTVSIPSAISGGNGSIWAAYGTLSLTGTNTFGGTLRSTTNAPSASVLSIGNVYAATNATLDMNTADTGSVTFNNLSVILGGLTGSRNLGLGNGNVSIGNNGLSTNYSGALSGNGSLTKIGTGTLTLSGANAYAGTTAISGGTLTIGGSGTLGSGTYGAAITDNAAFNYNSSASQTLSGIISGNGSLTNSGGATLTLSGVNTYTGNTTISAGELIGVSGGSCSNSAVAVAAGATNGVSVLAANGQWACSNLTYSAGTTYADFNFNLNSPSTATAPLLVISNLTFTVTPTISLRNVIVSTNGVYPLISYRSISGTPPTSFTAIGLSGSISNDTVNQVLDLVVTNGGNALLWAVGNGNWDINASANWKNAGGMTGLVYNDGYPVIFDDTASGTSPILVTNAVTVSPGLVTANLTNLDYVISGSPIAGGTALVKNGPGTLTLAGTNAFTGNITVNNGTLAGAFSATSGATNSAFGGASSTRTISVNAGSTLRFDNANVMSQNFAATNVPALIVSGTASNNVAGNNALGSVTLNGGTLAAATGNANYGAFNLNGTLTASGNSFITTSDPVNGQMMLTSIGANNVATASTIDVQSGGVLAISAPLGQVFTAESKISGLTKIDTGTLVLTGTNTYGGGTTLTAGILEADLNSALGTGQLTMNGGTLSNAVSATLTNAVSMALASTIGVGGSTLTLNGIISSSGALTKTGAGTLVLGGANTCTGATTVSGGELDITNWGAGTLGAITVGNTATTSTLGIIGGTLSLGGNTFFIGTGANSSYIGIVNQTGGSVAYTGGTATLIGNGSGNGSGTGIYNLSGGTFSTGTFSVTTRGVMIGVNNGCSGTFNLSGTGVLSLPLAELAVGRNDSPLTNTTSAFYQTGGAATVGYLSVGGGLAASVTNTATLSLTSGTFVATNFQALAAGVGCSATLYLGGGAQVTLPAFPTTHGSGSSANITFDFTNGWLAPLASSASYLPAGTFNHAYLTTNGVNFNVASAITNTVAQVLQNAASQAGTLTKSGAGMLTLSGANSYTGNTTVSGGTLSIQQAIIAPVSTVIVAGGAVLNLGFATTNVVAGFVTNGVSLPPGVYNVANAAASITGSGSLQVAGLDVWTGVQSSEWSVSILSPSKNWTTNSSPADYADGNQVQFDDTLTGTSTVDISVANVMPAAVTFNNNNTNYTLQGSAGIAGGTALNLNGTGTVTILNTNTYTGTTAVNAGILSLAGQDTNSSITVANNGVISETVSGMIAGSGVTFTYNSTNSSTLAGINTYTGATTLSAGTLQFQGSSSLPSASAISLGNATLQIRNDGAGNNGTNVLGNNITLSVASATDTIDVGNNGSGNTGNTVAFGALNNGTTNNAFASTINFTGANGYLQSYSSLGLSGLTGNTTVLNPTTASVIITGNVTNQETSFTGHFDTLNLGGTSTGNAINGAIADGSGYASVGNGDTRVTKSGTGAWTLNGNNTYHGPTTISAGTLQLGSATALGATTTNTTVASGATLDLNGQTIGNTISSIAGTGVGGNGALINGSANPAALTSTISGQNFTVGGSGNMSLSSLTTATVLTKVGGGTLTLSGASDNNSTAININGGICVLAKASTTSLHCFGSASTVGSGGTLQLGGTGGYQMYGGTSLTVNSGGVLDLNGQNQNYNALTGSLNLNGTGIGGGGALINSAAGTTSTLTFGTGNLVLQTNSSIGGAGNILITGGTTLPAGVISGAFALTKVGTGTVTVGQTNNYSGLTTVSAGELKFSTLAPAVTSVTVVGGATNGVLLAGAGGQWVTTGGLTNQAGSTLHIDYNGTAPSTTIPPIQVVNFVTNSGLTMVLSGLPGGFTVGQSYPLVTWTGSGPGDASAFTTLVLPHVTGNLSVSNGTTLYLTVTGSTEPLTWNTGSGNWDTATANWLDNTVTAATYIDGDQVVFDDAGGVSGNPVITLNSTFSPAAVTMNSGSHNYTISGTGGIGGSTSLTLDPANTMNLTLNTTNTYTGPTTIGGGTLTIGGAGKLGNGSYAGATAISNNATLEYSSSAAQTNSGAITGAGGLTADSTNNTTLYLTGTANTYSGLTTISNAVRLQVVPANLSPNTAFNIVGTSSGGGQLWVNASGTVSNNFTLSGTGYGGDTTPIGVFRTPAGAAVTFSGTITLAGNARLGCFGNPINTFSGQITGSYGPEFAEVVNSSGWVCTAILANTGTANNYTGNTSISAINYQNGTQSGTQNGLGSILKLGANDQIPNGAGYGIVAFNGGDTNHLTILELNGFNETLNGVTNVAAAGAIIRNTTAGASLLTIGDADTNSAFSGTITDGGATASLALTKIGAGTLTLSGANAYHGNTTINAGTLQVNNVTNGIGTGQATVNANGTLLLMYPNNTSPTFTNPITGAGTVAITATGAAASTITPIFNPASLAGFTGTITVDTSLTNIYTKMTASGIIDGSAAHWVVTGSSLTNSFLFAPGASVFRLGELSGNGTVGGSNTTNNIVEVGALNTSTNFSGLIKNSQFGAFTLGLTKVGGGTWTLTGTNTYTGNTTLSAGTLALGVNSALSTSTAVTLGSATLDAQTFANSVGTLDVTNAGTINLGSGGTLAFANSSAKGWSGGTLAITGNFVSGSSLRFGTTSGGLTGTQLGKISAAGYTSFILNAGGYLVGLNTPVISGVTTSQSITYGTPTVTLGGTVSASGPVYPANGETVSVTINGTTTNVAVSGGAGGFSVNFPTVAIPASGTPYPIYYGYAGNGTTLTAAPTNSSTSLTVNMATPTVTPVWSVANSYSFIYTGAGQGPTLTSVATSPQSTGTTNVYYQNVGGAGYGPSASAPTNVGSYQVWVTIGSDANNYTASSATNTFSIVIATASFSGLSSVTNSYGVTNLVLTGTVSAGGSAYPASGETVSASINGFPVNGTVTNGTGAFWINYNDPSLATNGVAGSPYTISYNYAGDGNLAGAADSSTTLVVTQAVPVINTLPTAATIIYGQMLSDAGPTGGSATPSGGTFAFTSPATVPPVGTALYSVIYTPLDTTNYTTVSTNVSVTVIPACTSPAIVGEVDGVTNLCAGNPLILTVTNATGSTPAYQWQTNNVSLLNATNASYTNAMPAVGDSGNYTCVLTNDCGAVTSSVVLVTIYPLPGTSGITGTNVVSHGHSASYSVTATAGSSYGWTVPGGASFSGGTSNAINVTFGLTSGTVSVIETNATGCTGAAQTLAVTVTNHAPMVSNFSMGAASGTPVTVQIIDGKHAPTDADGDALTVSAVQNPSAANGVVTTDGTNVTYTATNTFAGTDTFTYAVSDSYGGTNTATVTVNVVTNGGGYNLISGPVNNGNGTSTIHYAGIPGYSYALETTPSLTLPITWTPVQTNTAATNGSLSFTFSTAVGQGYFRTHYISN